MRQHGTVTSSAVVILALLLAILGLGCVRLHLNDRFGVLQQRLFQTQASLSRSAVVPKPLNGEEASIIMAKHRLLMGTTSGQGQRQETPGMSLGNEQRTGDGGFVLRSH